MKVLVRKLFIDKFDHSRRYEPGMVVDFEDSRAMDIIALGLADAMTEPEPETDAKAEEMPVTEEIQQGLFEDVSEHAPEKTEPEHAPKSPTKKKK